METQCFTPLLLVVLVAVLSSGLAEEKFFGDGGALVLRPPFSEKITSLSWKHNNNLVAEWMEGKIDLQYYDVFEGRTTLDTATGRLEITNTSSADSGVYTVEINLRVQPVSYNVKIIKEVTQPTVTLQPLVCTSAHKECKLLCAGDTEGAGPVSYSWKMGGGEWEDGEKSRSINDKETQSIKTFSCRMKNPISEKQSDIIPNVFFRSAAGTSVSVDLLLVIMAAVFGAGF